MKIGKIISAVLVERFSPQPGEYKFTYYNQEPAGIAFCCPCGCQELCHINFKNSPHEPKWCWDGDRERPTISPSIRINIGCKWHGHLIDGKFYN